MKTSTLLWYPLLLFLLVPALLSAQQAMPAPPPLPFGLKWTMTEREVLAALKQAGLKPRLVVQGNRFNAEQVKRIVQDQGFDEKTVRAAQTWKQYNCGTARVDEIRPNVALSIEFLQNRLFKVEYTWPTASEEEDRATVDTLAAYYRGVYGTPAAESNTAMPKFPPGYIEDLEGRPYLGTGSGLALREERSFVFRGWSGTSGERLYGTMVYTGIYHDLMLTHITGPLPEQRR